METTTPGWSDVVVESALDQTGAVVMHWSYVPAMLVCHGIIEWLMKYKEPRYFKMKMKSNT